MDNKNHELERKRVNTNINMREERRNTGYAASRYVTHLEDI